MVYVSHVGSVWVLSVHVGLPLSIRKGWVLLLKRGYSGPPIQSSALGRSNVLSALMHSRCPFSWKKERQREKWEGGQRERIGSYNPQSRPLAVSQPIALVWGILAGAPGALCCWVSFQNKSDCIYHFLSLALFPSHVISRQTAKYRVAKGVGGPLWNCYSYLTQYSYGTLVLVADFNDCSFLRSFWVFHPSLYLISYLGHLLVLFCGETEALPASHKSLQSGLGLLSRLQSMLETPHLRGVQHTSWLDVWTTSTGSFQCRGAAALLWAVLNVQVPQSTLSHCLHPKVRRGPPGSTGWTGPWKTSLTTH